MSTTDRAVNTVRTTTLTTLALGTLACGWALLAPPQAHADDGADYGSAHGAQICAALAANPTFDGILALPTPTLGDAIQKNDLGPFGMGAAVGTAIRLTCPQFTSLGLAFGRWHSTLA